jgi:NhaA family Na+:H+ antiporter
MLLWASAIMIILIALNKKNVQNAVFYILPGLLLWLFILKSGIHSTIAGVLLAMTIPVKMKEDNLTKNRVPLLKKMESFITPIVTFIIVPVFALANAGVKFSIDLSGPLQNISKGIFCGLVFGKPIGIFLSSYVACKIGLADLPTNSNWKMLFSVGIIAGIGFTMSIFIDNLAFEDPDIVAAGKRVVLLSSLTAAIIGSLILYASTKKTMETNKPNKQKNENN